MGESSRGVQPKRHTEKLKQQRLVDLTSKKSASDNLLAFRVAIIHGSRRPIRMSSFPSRGLIAGILTSDSSPLQTSAIAVHM
jgi:hypothetical protein